MEYDIPVCIIMGVKIAAINMEWLVDFTKRNISDLGGEYMCVSNVHTTVTAYENEEYMRIQNSSLISIPDGGPLSSVGRKRGCANMERTPGPSYMDEIFQISEQYGWKHYFYGSTEDTLEKLNVALKEKYPNIHIVGMYSPPFRELSKKEREDDIKKINESSADFIWVGLGAPKQEKWMYLNKKKVNGFMIGVGAGFDYFAGNIKRAPLWMQKHNLEWLFRLLQDPQRLFIRYLKTNWKFIINAVLQGK